MKTENFTKSSPALWVPTLYFASGVPYFVVNHISVLMYTKMGVPDGDMALFTSLLYLPWVIKPFWSPFVDLLARKRNWILAMQALMTAALVLLIWSIPNLENEQIQTGNTPIGLFRFSLILFAFSAFSSANFDIAADGFYMLSLRPGQQAAWVGVRSAFYRLASIFVQGGIVWVAGAIELQTTSIRSGWQAALALCAVIFCTLTIYHSFVLPRPKQDRPAAKSTCARDIYKGFKEAFATFFRKKDVLCAITFMLLYRLPEAFLLKLCAPFLLAPKAAGGLGLTTSEVGVAYGTVGVIALTAGGLLGGVCISRFGLRRTLRAMAAAITLPSAAFIYLAAVQPTDIVTIATAIAVEQLGYGFGFTAYMMYMMHFANGRFQTSHYAICTAFMALSMLLPGAIAGYIREMLQYQGFFIMVMTTCIATFVVTENIRKRLPDDYGKS